MNRTFRPETKFGALVKILGFTQQETAKILGTSQANVSRLVRKGILTPGTAAKYAALLSCEPEDLLGGLDRAERPPRNVAPASLGGLDRSDNGALRNSEADVRPSKVEQRMRAMGIRAGELADRSGLPAGGIYRMRKYGFRIPKVWKKYAAALNCKVADLIEDEDK